MAWASPGMTNVGGAKHGHYDADPARSGPRIIAENIRPRDSRAVAVWPGDGGQPYPRRQYGRDRAADSRRGAAAFRARRPFDGRLHRLRNHQTATGPVS